MLFTLNHIAWPCRYSLLDPGVSVLVYLRKDAVFLCWMHVPLAVALIDGRGSAKRPLGSPQPDPPPHSDLTQSVQCSLALSGEKPQSFLTSGRWCRLPPKKCFSWNSAWEDLADGGWERERESNCALENPSKKKRRRLMPLLILNGEKSDKSSWHNNVHAMILRANFQTVTLNLLWED